MFVSFGMAEHMNGECVLRFDDTNPEAEKQEYIDHIQDIVAWMGWKPSKASTHSTLSLCAMHCPAPCACTCLMRMIRKSFCVQKFDVRWLHMQMGSHWFGTILHVLQSIQFGSLITMANILCGIH